MQRTLMASAALQDYLDWPGACQVLKRTCRTTQLKSGQVCAGCTFAITSLTPLQASPTDLACFRRAHGTLENRVHSVRDVTFGEDAGRVHTAHAAHALAALRNALLNTLAITVALTLLLPCVISLLLFLKPVPFLLALQP